MKSFALINSATLVDLTVSFLVETVSKFTFIFSLTTEDEGELIQTEDEIRISQRPRNLKIPLDQVRLRDVCVSWRETIRGAINQEGCREEWCFNITTFALFYYYALRIADLGATREMIFSCPVYPICTQTAFILT